jgi:hypothetical protein
MATAKRPLKFLTQSLPLRLRCEHVLTRSLLLMSTRPAAGRARAVVSAHGAAVRARRTDARDDDNDVGDQSEDLNGAARCAVGAAGAARRGTLTICVRLMFAIATNSAEWPLHRGTAKGQPSTLSVEKVCSLDPCAHGSPQGRHMRPRALRIPRIVYVSLGKGPRPAASLLRAYKASSRE